MLLTTCLVFLLSCKHSNKGSSTTQSKEPAVQLTDTTPDLLLTWVDDQGEFHTAQSISDIKEPNRGQVRVVFANKDSENPDQVLVADLTQKRADGTYAMRNMSRGAWDEIGAKNRKSRMEALAAPAPVLPDAGHLPTELVAVIYGAEWCQACHQMAQYLKSKGIKYVEKDVDASAYA